MTFPSKRLAICLFALVAVGGPIALAVLSLMIIPTDSIAEQASKRIVVGMGYEQVGDIFEHEFPSFGAGWRWEYSQYCWNDGSSLVVTYGLDGLVREPPDCHISHETHWEKLERRVKELFASVATRIPRSLTRP
jgi:hypothetical protein